MGTLGGFTALRFQGSVLRQSDLIRKSVRERSRVMMDLREVSHLERFGLSVLYLTRLEWISGSPAWASEHISHIGARISRHY